MSLAISITMDHKQIDINSLANHIGDIGSDFEKLYTDILITILKLTGGIIYTLSYFDSVLKNYFHYYKILLIVVLFL